MKLYTISKDFSDGRRMRFLVTAMNQEDAIELACQDEKVKKDLQKYDGDLKDSNIALIGLYNKNVSQVLGYSNEIVNENVNEPKLVSSSTTGNIAWVTALLFNMIYFCILALANYHNLSISAFKSVIIPFLIMFIPVAIISVLLVYVFVEHENDIRVRDHHRLSH